MSVDALSTGTTHQYHYQPAVVPSAATAAVLLQHSTSSAAAATAQQPQKNTPTTQSFYNNININSIGRKSTAAVAAIEAAAIISSSTTSTAVDFGLKNNDRQVAQQQAPPLTSSSQHRLNTAGAAPEESSLPPLSSQNTLKRQQQQQLSLQQATPSCRKLTPQEAAALQNAARATAGFIIQRPVSPPIGGHVPEGVDNPGNLSGATDEKVNLTRGGFADNNAAIAKGQQGHRAVLGREGSLRKVGNTAAAAVATQKAAGPQQAGAAALSFHNSMPTGGPTDSHNTQPATDLSSRMIVASSNPPILPPIARDGQITQNALQDTTSQQNVGAQSTARTSVERKQSNYSGSASNKLLRDRGLPPVGGSLSTGMTPEQAMTQYMQKLSAFEHHEIFQYPKIYFCGHNAKKRPGAVGGQNNCGYDDESGCYIPVPHDHIAYRYEILKVIGKGSFGQVLKVYDHKTNQYVALKIVRNEKRFHRQAQEEIRILVHLKKQDVNDYYKIVHIYDSFEFRHHQCITFELLSMNLYELTKRNRFSGFSLQLVRKFAYSLLQCLECLYRNKIIHCDLKPENILLKQQGRSAIKVIDFGSSCYEHQRVYTYIQSRFYRAPEVILGAKYGMAIDIWSFGCILAELFTGIPIFPGEDEADQLACIIELLDMPPQTLLDQSKRARNFISSRGYPRYCTVSMQDDQVILGAGRSRRGKVRGPPGSKTWSRALRECDDEIFIDFLKNCLKWLPEERFTPAQALRHDWLRRRPNPLPAAAPTGNSGTTTNRGQAAAN